MVLADPCKGRSPRAWLFLGARAGQPAQILCRATPKSLQPLRCGALELFSSLGWMNVAFSGWKTPSSHHFLALLDGKFFQRERRSDREHERCARQGEMVNGTRGWSSNCFSLSLGVSAGTRRNPLVLCSKICVLR